MRDFESTKEKLKQTEVERENIKEELDVLKRESEALEDFVREDLNETTEDGVKSALQRYNEKCQETEKQNSVLKKEAEDFQKLQNVVGDSLSKNLLRLSVDDAVLNDAQVKPKVLEKILEGRNTLGRMLEEYEEEQAEVKKQLGKDLFSLVVEKDSELNETQNALRMANALKSGKNVKEIVKGYEDLIDSQRRLLKIFSRKVG